MTTSPSTNRPDVLLVGAGIMSATLAVLFKELDPSLNIEIYEVLGSAAQESSNAWNNAGTGHAALCELNYTPEESDGRIDIAKALLVNTEFDLSRQLWAYLVKKGAIKDPRSFIHPVPHMSFVRGPEHIAFLKKRFEALSAHPCYHGMEYSEDKKQTIRKIYCRCWRSAGITSLSKSIWSARFLSLQRSASRRSASSFQMQRKKIGGSK